MSDYQHSVDVIASANQVFQFVSDPENMPRFLPTLEEAHCVGADRVEMKGDSHGHRYVLEGNLHLDPDERSMHWGSNRNPKYRGQLQVTGDETRCTVSVRLVFEPGEPTEERISQKAGAGSIQRELEESLEKVKAICEKEMSAIDAERGPYLG